MQRDNRGSGVVFGKHIIAACLLGLLTTPVLAGENEQYWFARGGLLVVNQPQMEPMKLAVLSYGYNVSRDSSFEVDLFGGLGEAASSQGNSSLGVSGASGFIVKRAVLSNVAYLKAKIGGAMVDKRYTGDYSNLSETRFRAVPGLGAGVLHHGTTLRRLVIEAELSYVDTETYMATIGLHTKF